MVLLILAILWGAVLIPPALRARAESSPADSIGTFRRQLIVLQRATPGAPSAFPAPYVGANVVPIRPVTRPLSRSRAQKRRRDIFCGLLAAMAGSLLLGFLPSLRVMWTLHLVLDVVFAGYVALLVRMRHVAVERELKVRFLPRSSPEPALLLRRTGN